MVTAAVTYFRPMQAAYSALDWNRNVIAAAGLTDSRRELDPREVAALFRQLAIRAVDLRSGQFTDVIDPLTFDFLEAASDSATTSELATEIDTAGIKQRPHFMPVYFVGRPPRPDRIVLPVFGQGMWSTIRGFVSLDGQAERIVSIVIHEHQETPGIGDRIEDPDWLLGWSDKVVYDTEGELAIHLNERTGESLDPSSIDGITGATVTAKGVVELTRFWLSDSGYGPMLETVPQVEVVTAKMSIKRVFTDPILDENPVTVQMLGICSALAVTRSMWPALVMAISIIGVLAFSNGMVSLLRNVMPRSVRLILEMTLIASAVTVTDEAIKAYAPEMSATLSVFVGLIITNCIVLGRAETFALTNPVGRSLWSMHWVGTGVGYGALLLVVAAVRELLGNGTLFDYELVSNAKKWALGQQWGIHWKRACRPTGERFSCDRRLDLDSTYVLGERNDRACPPTMPALKR